MKRVVLLLEVGERSVRVEYNLTDSEAVSLDMDLSWTSNYKPITKFTALDTEGRFVECIALRKHIVMVEIHEAEAEEGDE